MNDMISVAQAEFSQIPEFAVMESDPGVAQFVFQTSLSKHQERFGKPEVLYLAISNDRRLIGFMILEIQEGGRVIEFVRIVIRERGHGFGQEAIRKMEEFCRKNYRLERMWLDVYAENARGIHIYEKLGFMRSGEKPSGSRTLWLYEKMYV